MLAAAVHPPSQKYHSPLAILLVVGCIDPVPAHASVAGSPSPPRHGSQSGTREEPALALQLTLEEAVELASSNGSRADRTARSAKIAALQVKSARAAYFPRLDVAVSANQSASGSEFKSSEVSFRRRIVGDFRSGINFSASVPIDLSGIIARQVRNASINNVIAILEQERAAIETAADVQVAYLAALQAQNAVDLDQQVVAAIRDLIEAPNKLPPAVTSFLGLELANAQQTLNQRNAVREQALDGLKRLLGLEPETEVILASRLPRTDEVTAWVEVSNDAMKAVQRRDVAIARHRVDQAELAVKRADDQRRPSMRAGVYLDQYVGGKFVSETGKTSTRNLGFNLSVNLPVLNVDAGQAGNTKMIARLQAEQARSDYAEVRRQVGYELKQARAAWTRAKDRLTRLPNAKDAARALDLAQRNLLGATPEEAQARLAQLSNARQTWRSAEGAAQDAVVELATAAIRLRRAEGRTVAKAN